tara:strand:+ start:4246 stop:4431 length:186 start_codon:yes stop_codon:yes gene_type:complete
MNLEKEAKELGLKCWNVRNVNFENKNSYCQICDKYIPCKIFVKIVNDKLVNLCKKCGEVAK